MYKTPETVTTWVPKVKEALASGGEGILDLVVHRPIVTWFCETELAIHQLIKVTPRPGDDYWVIQGRGRGDSEYPEPEHSVSFTLSLTPLKTVLNYPQRDNGWVLCEFESEVEFYNAALEYLQQEP